MVSPRLEDYKVGIITALDIEQASVEAMLDQEHSPPADYKRHEHDSNRYNWGRIGSHNIVIASLALGVFGTTMATTTVLHMKYALPKLKWGLMVGIGAGVPSKTRDIRLGDVAVSQPSGNSGVFQYDLGKRMHDDEWERLDWLARPPDILLKALSDLQAKHWRFGTSKAHAYLHEASYRHRKWRKEFARPEEETDRLFESSYSHQHPGQACSTCDLSKVVQRPPREAQGFQIHYGVIASGNSLVKDPRFREKILEKENQCICIEMEAAGVMNELPCLVIRGICDYADSHKNDTWQRYASATAAAFAKELLMISSDVQSIPCDQTIDHETTHTSTWSNIEGISSAKTNEAAESRINPTSSRSPSRPQQVGTISQAVPQTIPLPTTRTVPLPTTRAPLPTTRAPLPTTQPVAPRPTLQTAQWVQDQTRLYQRRA